MKLADLMHNIMQKCWHQQINSTQVIACANCQNVATVIVVTGDWFDEANEWIKGLSGKLPEGKTRRTCPSKHVAPPHPSDN